MEIQLPPQTGTHAAMQADIRLARETVRGEGPNLHRPQNDSEGIGLIGGPSISVSEKTEEAADGSMNLIETVEGINIEPQKDGSVDTTIAKVAWRNGDPFDTTEGKVTVTTNDNKGNIHGNIVHDPGHARRMASSIARQVVDRQVEAQATISPALPNVKKLPAPTTRRRGLIRSQLV
jgi:hypothetical protein